MRIDAQLCLRTFVLLFSRASSPPPSHESRKTSRSPRLAGKISRRENRKIKIDFLVNRYRLLVKPNVLVGIDTNLV